MSSIERSFSLSIPAQTIKSRGSVIEQKLFQKGQFKSDYCFHGEILVQVGGFDLIKTHSFTNTKQLLEYRHKVAVTN